MSSYSRIVEVNGMRGTYKYSELDEIGKGLFVVVYRGHDKDKDKAIKRVDPKTFGDLKSTRNELDISIDVLIRGNNNLVKLFDINAPETTLFVVMKLYEHGSLRSYMNNNDVKAFDEPVIKRMAEHMANALSESIVRPENSTSPNNFNFVLTDFGVSRHLDESKLANTLCGTPLYIAPEIILRIPYDNRCDLWSIGVLLYRCFRGAYPFNARHHMRFVTSGAKASFEIVPIVFEGFEELEDFLKRLLVKDFNRRMKMIDFLNHRYTASRSDTGALAQATQQVANLSMAENATMCTTFTLQVELNSARNSKTTTTKPDKHGFSWKLTFDHQYDTKNDNHILIASVCNPEVRRNKAQTGIRIYIKDYDDSGNARVFCDYGAVMVNDGIRFKWLLTTSKFRQLCSGGSLSIIYEIEYESISTTVADEEEKTLT